MSGVGLHLTNSQRFWESGKSHLSSLSKKKYSTYALACAFIKKWELSLRAKAVGGIKGRGAEKEE